MGNDGNGFFDTRRTAAWLAGIAAADGLDPLDDEPESVPQHGQLAGGGGAARDVDDKPVAFAEQGLHRVAVIIADGGAFRRPSQVPSEFGNGRSTPIARPH